jgi:flagellar hook-length control protein FliK
LRTLQNLLGHIEREQGIQLQQSDSNAASSPITTPQNQQWLPLLFHHHQQLQLVEFFIDKEEKNNAQGEKKNHWFINLHFDLPKLGKLGIEISMFENECNTTFWSESSSTLSQIAYHVKPLRERLTEQGIIVSDVQSRHGTLSKRKHIIEQHLVDVKT